jgi:hypothetical protein
MVQDMLHMEVNSVFLAEDRRGRGSDRAGAPPRPRKGPSRSTAAAKEGIKQEHRRGRGTGPRRSTAEDWSQGMEPPEVWSRGISDNQQATRKRVKKGRKIG